MHDDPSTDTHVQACRGRVLLLCAFLACNEDPPLALVESLTTGACRGFLRHDHLQNLLNGPKKNEDTMNLQEIDDSFESSIAAMRGGPCIICGLPSSGVLAMRLTDKTGNNADALLYVPLCKKCRRAPHKTILEAVQMEAEFEKYGGR